MFSFGWKKKTLILKVTILSSAHQLAQELSPFIAHMLELYSEASKTGDISRLQQHIEQSKEGDTHKLLWEPAEIYGWMIQATLYKKAEHLWWLVHATRKTNVSPSDKDITLLDKILEELGAQPLRHMVIGPRNTGGVLPFGWWTWQNREPLLDLQVNKDKKGKDMIRIVPLGTRETDGFESVNLVTKDQIDKEPDAGT